MPSYNTAEFILQAIESVRAQTYTNWELLVVDDGSSDDSRNLLNTFASDSKVRVFLKENGGTASARNLAIKEAQGTLLAFIDSDDVWAKRKLDLHVLTHISYPEIDVTFSGWQRIDEKGIAFGDLHVPQHRAYEVVDFLRGFGITTASLAVCQRSVVDKVQGFDEQIQVVEDLDFWYRILSFGGRIVGVPEVLTEYRNRRDQITRNIPLHHKNWLVMSEKLRRLFPTEWAAHRHLAHMNHFRVMSNVTFLMGQNKKAREYLWKALAESPVDFVVDYRNALLTGAVLSSSALPFVKKFTHSFWSRVLQEFASFRENE
jgi:glycosyltransferase involved in cell wall biosynthesis